MKNLKSEIRNPRKTRSPKAEWGRCNPAFVAQTAKSAVSRVAKPAELGLTKGLPIGQSALRQVWQPALRGRGLAARSVGLVMVGLVSLHAIPSASAETLLFKGATVHTVSGQPIPAGEVLVRDGRIAAVGKSVTSGDAKVVDLAGLHLFPGMIALDTSLGLREIGGVRATRDEREVGAFTPDVQSWIAVNPDSELLPVARANGGTE